MLGELDLVSSPALQEELDRAIASDTEVIVLDLGKLTFMDSTGCMSWSAPSSTRTKRAGGSS